MFAQTFSVISYDHDHCSFIPSLLLEVSKEVAQRRIRVGNFSVVRPVFVKVRIRGRRLVWIMGIIEVHPNEACTVWVCVEPRFCVLLYFHPSALETSPPGLSRRELREVIVEFKPPIETGREILAVEDHGAYECRSLVTLLFEQFCKSGIFDCQRDAEIADSVRARQKPGH